MDENMKLKIKLAAPQPNWEDEEKATNDVKVLREEYRRLLYASEGESEPKKEGNGESPVRGREEKR